MKEEEERTPLRTILQNFLNHIEKLDNEKLEGSYDKEFQELKLFSEFLKTSKQYSCSQGEKEVNKKKNRYKDILPFDCSRVILEDYAGIPGSDYINANYIKGASGSPAYIASQGPLPHTVNDFWRMVVQCEVQVIVMACNEEESGKHKCENYWVEHEGEEKQFGMVAIQLIKASVVCPDFLVRTMRLKYTKNHSSLQEERTVCQFHYSAWPDHGVPPLVRPLLDMVRLVRDTQASETLPVLVHCSAGCGRTGTICAIDYVWGLLRAGKLTKDFSLFKLVREMRKQRIAMVQTKEQYILVHHAVKELFNEQLRMIDSHPYENIDVNGMVKDSPEPVYATITCDNCNEEKQDGNEKECTIQDNDDAPPLPHKRKPYTAHTKQEKEVENLTEKQRSNAEQISPGTSSSSSGILHKPRIAKLRALFERTSLSRDSKSVQVKQVTRSHSLGAVRKVDEVVGVQPIPSKGILRVPQLSVNSDSSSLRSSRPALPIKRSKSLKILSSGERSKFSVPSSYTGTSQVFQHTNSLNKELYFSTACSVPKSCSDIYVKDEVKPFVPPKKTAKDKASDKKHISSSNSNKPGNYQNVQCVARKSCEDMQMMNTRMFAIDCWKRRSLDSLPLENDNPLLPSNTTHSQVIATKSLGQNELIREPRKAMPKSHEHTLASTRGELSVASNERKCRDSVSFSNLQHLTVEAQRKVNAVVGGLGTRERRNSFRQAISKDAESTSQVHEHQSVGLNKPFVCTSKGDTTVESTVTDAELAQSRTQFLSRKSVRRAPHSSQRVRPSESQKILGKSECKPHLIRSVDGVAGRTVCNVRGESSGYVYHSDIGKLEVRKLAKAESSVGNPNGTIKVTENLCSGKIQNDIPLRLDAKSVPQNLSSLAVINSSVANRPASSGENMVDCQCDSKPVGPGNVSLNHCPSDIPGYKNANISGTRGVNTGHGRLAMPGASCSRLPEKSTNSSGAYTPFYMDIPHSNQTSVVHQGTTWTTGAPEESTSINQEVNSVSFRRPGETFLCSRSKMKGSKGDNNLSTLKQEVPRHGNQPQAERILIPGNGGVSKRTEWAGRVTSGVANGGLLETEKSRQSFHHPQNKEQRTHAGGQEKSELDVTSPWRGTSTSENIGNNRPAHKLTVKLRKESTSINKGTMNPQLHHGSQDDLALCTGGATSLTSSRVRRHASVVLFRHSLIETNDVPPLAPLAVWNASQSGISDGNTRNPLQQTINKEDMEAWNGAPGIDVDMVAASIKPNHDHGTPLTRALEAFHLRKPRGAAVSPPQQRKYQQPQITVKKQHYL